MIWAVHRKSDMKVGVVEGSSITVFNSEHRPACPVCDALPAIENSRLHVLDVLHAVEIDWPMRDLEVCMGLQNRTVATSLQAGSASAAVIREMFWHAQKEGFNLVIESPAVWHKEKIFDFVNQLPVVRSGLEGVMPQEAGWDRFEEEMRDSLRPLMFVEVKRKGKNHKEEMVFDMDKGIHFSNSGEFHLMDEIRAGGNPSGIALGLLED